MTTPQPLVEIRGLVKGFPDRHGHVRAVDGVDLAIAAGSTLALVGESGSGKSTLARCVLRLLRWDAGQVVVDGQDLGRLSGRALRRFRRHAQMVFQDPYGSLNPRMRVQQTLEEPLRLHTDLTGPARRARVAETLGRVHLDGSYASRFPAELSGGEQQRVGIARAIITEPRLIVLDEPTAALDAQVRESIYELLRELQRTMELTYLLISHDLSSVWRVADRVAVMYRGRMVETGPIGDVFLRPSHPYTVALMSAVPHIELPGIERRPRLVIEGDPASVAAEGCHFYGRCPIGVEGLCTVRQPGMEPNGAGHDAACFRVDAVRSELTAYHGNWARGDDDGALAPFAPTSSVNAFPTGREYAS